MTTLTQGQQEALGKLEGFLRSEDLFFLLSGSAGTGKAQPMDEPTLTPHGFKPLGDISVDDLVISEDGKPIRVSAVYDHDRLPMYKVSFSDGSSTRCCSDHLWEVQTAKLATNKKYKVLPLSTLLALHEGFKTKKKQGYKYRVRLTKPVEFLAIEEGISPWTLGYTLGNGCSRLTESNSRTLAITIGGHDFEGVISKFKPSEINRHRFKKDGVHEIHLSKPTRDAYESFGLFGVKSIHKYIPPIFLTASITQRKGLLAGLLDSDGSCNDNKARFSTSSKRLADDFCSLVRSLGGTARLYSIERKDRANMEYSVQFRTPFNPFTLQRKADNYTVRTQDLDGHKRIIDITYLGNLPGRCIQVESERHLYLTNDFTVTHNTYMLEQVLPLVTDGDVIGCGPTHKSVAVLATRLNGIDCMTIHKFLGLKPKKSGTTSSLVKQRNYDPTQWMGVSVVLLDELSMVSSDLVKHIKDDALAWNRKYIFIGDRYQLPPVDEKYCPIYDWDIPDRYKHELTEIVRQASDNPVIRAATGIRDSIIGGKEPPLRQYKADNNTGIYLLKPAEWEAKLSEYVHMPEYKDNTDFMRILAYRNATVHSYNQKVRQLLGEDLTYPFSVGDKVVANEAWVVDEEVLMNTGQEFTITEIYPHTHPVYSDIFGFFLELEEIPGYPVYVLDYEKSASAYKAALQAAAIVGTKEGDWRPYYGLQEYFADLRPVFSLTTHKAQGSTFDNVMVDFRDIYTNRKLSEADRCYYVAITRARYNVYLLA